MQEPPFLVLSFLHPLLEVIVEKELAQMETITVVRNFRIFASMTA
jgi:hypothetical protein